MSRAEDLFAAEARLRAAALSLTDWERGSATGDGKPPHTGRNEARKVLRVAAVEYAALANAVEPATKVKP